MSKNYFIIFLKGKNIPVCRKSHHKRWHICLKNGIIEAEKVAYSQKSGQEMRKNIQSKLTAKVSLDLIRGQPAKRRMRPV